MSHPFSLNLYLGTLAVDLGFFPFDNGTYLSLSDSHESIIHHSEFNKLRYAVKRPRPFSALPLVISHEASPKAISRRTSYIQIRLEFLR